MNVKREMLSSCDEVIALSRVAQLMLCPKTQNAKKISTLKGTAITSKINSRRHKQ